MRLSFGRFVFDSRLRAVFAGDAKIELSPKAFSLLEALIEAKPAPVPREVLFDRLWPDTYVDPANLHNLVAEIRRALGDTDHEIVRTVYGVGYGFDARDTSKAWSSSRFVLWIRNDVFPLALGETIIGRDADCAVVIDSTDVSRHHARLFVSEDHVTVEDLGSKNGTFVSGDQLRAPRVLRGAEDLLIGRTAVLLRKRGSLKSTATAANRPVKAGGRSS